MSGWFILVQFSRVLTKLYKTSVFTSLCVFWRSGANNHNMPIIYQLWSRFELDIWRGYPKGRVQLALWNRQLCTVIDKGNTLRVGVNSNPRVETPFWKLARMAHANPFFHSHHVFGDVTRWPRRTGIQVPLSPDRETTISLLSLRLRSP